MSPSRLVLAVVPLAAVLLSGCSGAVTAGGGSGPGVAVRVADDQVRLTEVDLAADGVCRGIMPQLEERGQAVPLGDVRRYAVRTLATRLQVEQWAADRDVTAGATYETRRAQLEGQAASMPADVRDEYVRVESTQAFTQDLLVQVGRTALQAQGTAAPTDEAAFEAGALDFQEWATGRSDEVEIDPRFGLSLDEGTFVVAETGSSVAVSDAARQGVAEQVDPAYAASLPESQRCGG